MRTANAFLAPVAVGLSCLLCISSDPAVQAKDKAGSAHSQVDEPAALRNEQLGVVFDRNTGTLTAIENRLTGETYRVQGDQFEIDGSQCRVSFSDAKLVGLTSEANALTADYRSGKISIQACYTLRGHCIEKQLTLKSDRPCGLKKVVVSRPTFSASGLQVVPYRYSKYERKPGKEPNCTFFGRTPKGGFFAGLEIPFDASAAVGNEVVLAFAPSMKLAAGERLTFEPAYFGVYRRQPRDQWQRDSQLPLPSESDAMVQMTSTILGPPRFGLVPTVCGCQSEMCWPGGYDDQSVAADMKSLDFLAQCGFDWVTDSHPWGGETQKMNLLRQDDKYEPGPLPEKFLAHARQVGVKVAMWSSLTNTQPWVGGKPFRADRPDWILDAGTSPPSAAPEWRKTTTGCLRGGGNCLGNRAFVDWLERINLEGMASGRYAAWVIDGDFFGGGGWFTTTVPVDCQSDKHDHLPGDSNYACQRALAQLVESVRKHYPNTYIAMCRPAMDLGVWTLKNTDVCFTTLEWTVFDKANGTNLTAGDEIRTRSRTRVHHEFLPHYLDWPILFPNRLGTPQSPSNWPNGGHLDYILLSALSSSPNQIYNIPIKHGIPDADQAEIHKWLDWGRKNIEYLKVRKDLLDWPAAGKVDGSAHVIGNQGVVFLFNPSKTALEGQFALTEENIGLKATGDFQVSQQYPASNRTIVVACGQTVRWEVPAESVVILDLRNR